MSHSENNLFETQCLKAHNLYRTQHGCPPLQLNQNLSSFASKWALKIATNNKLEHSSGHNYGENLYMARGTQIDGETPVKAWYSEVKDYNYGAGKFSPKTGHFTQLIWKNSTDLGVGIARKGDASFVVASYSPAGNVQGDFKANVPPAVPQKRPKTK